MVPCIRFPSSIPQGKDFLFICYMSCFPERSALFSVKTLLQRHFSLSPIMFPEQHVRHTMSSFHGLSFSIVTVLHTSWQSPSCQKCVTSKDFLDHRLHLSLVNNGVFVHLDCCYLEEYSLWFLSKIIPRWEAFQRSVFSPKFLRTSPFV